MPQVDTSPKENLISHQTLLDTQRNRPDSADVLFT